ncbi:MAG: glycosyltransferase [Candidatus Accumulibacter sp.]|uniref:Glycosyltransferase n=1 Tax=Candidatus Accumulibacter affinis TaxID=2954384 RepID=A0A935TBD0_9PROT|nr:glycosyltransferase [Candidatus Accumulibacter affinis]
MPLGAQCGDPPLVSIITRTCSGRSLYLRQAILSVAHQTYPRIEHIIVEDGGESQRTMAETMSSVTHRDIVFIGLTKVGPSTAGNAGLSAANGRWCLFLDDDDLLFADHVELLVDALLRNPSAAAAYSLAWQVVTDAAKLIEDKYLEVSHYVPAVMRQTFDRDVLLHHNFLAIQSVIFERRLFLERGGFDADMDALEDWVLWMRYSQGNFFIYVPKVTSMYRTPSDPQTGRLRQAAFDAAYPLARARVAARHKGHPEAALAVHQGLTKTQTKESNGH